MAIKIVFCIKDFLSKETNKILLKKIPHVKIIGEFDDANDLLLNLKNRIPDIVIYDLQSNNLRDIAEIKKILTISPELKVIVTCTFEDTRTIAATFNLGAIAFLTKRDLSVSELSNAINYANENNHYVSRCCEYKMVNINKMIQLNYSL